MSENNGSAEPLVAQFPASIERVGDSRLSVGLAGCGMCMGFAFEREDESPIIFTMDAHHTLLLMSALSGILSESAPTAEHENS